jgi:putative flavoprotein involved in K+ transport
VLSEHDESTRTAGVFLVGPIIRHQKQVFCFIYRFRQRFAVVGCEIARRLGVRTEQVERAFRAAGMFLDDLSCCVNQCDC